MTQSKSRKSGCGCFSLLLFGIVGIAGGYFYGRNFIGQELTPSRSAMITPASAYATGFISTNPREWEEISQFGTNSAQEILTQNLQELIDENLTEETQTIDVEKDILPWLGGVSVAVLPSSSAGLDSNVALIMGVSNKFKANSFFQKYKNNLQTNPLETKYNGITVYEIDIENSEKIWATFFNNYLVISEQEEVVNQIIDTHKGKTSLANNYPQNLVNNNAVISIYFPEYDRILLKALKDSISEGELDEQVEEQLNKIKTIFMNMSIEDHGLKFTTLVKLSEPLEYQNNRQPVSENLLRKIPENSIFMINGNGINQLWQQLEIERKNIPELNELISETEIAVNQWLNLDLGNDIFSWLDGEFAFAVAGNVEKPLFNNNFYGLLLLESSNKNQGENTLSKLENMAQFLPFASINRTEIEGINITEWNNYQTTITSYAWLDNNNFLLTLGKTFNPNEILDKNSSILNSDNFKITTDSLAKNNYGYIYFDYQKALDFALNIDPNFYEEFTPEMRALSDSIKAFALTSSSIDDTTDKVELNISLIKKNELN
ncbi:DUF3352 domain-containing protein [Cyanobacterium aponinum UTEX 3221]|uniref:DUF3352 domain-containing protein n=1 Tax=Cyanobacterium aponinum TaxID=379064 RepID=UPI002B4BD7A9|nr:DUF3352 domain-containing protein [Cyanobacterium aponinum]WRL37210.1 DUF3352 domain-containing protein [Cyanobacterium aponinum UTEX 3221]